MASIGTFLEKVGKYYIYKKAKVAFDAMMVDFKKDNPSASLNIESGYYSKFDVMEELHKRLKIKGRDATDAATKELLASKDTIISLATEDLEKYKKILAYIKTTTAAEYEPTLLATATSATDPNTQIRQIPTLEVRNDEINDVRKSGRIVTPAAEDIKLPATKNWLLNNSYKYGFLLYLDTALYFIGLDAINNLLKGIKPAEGTSTLTPAQIAQHNLILRNIIGRYQTSVELISGLTIDASTLIAAAPPPPPALLPPVAFSGKGPYASGTKPVPTFAKDSLITKLGAKAISTAGKTAANYTWAQLDGTILNNAGAANRSAANVTSITLHLTAGGPQGTAESTVRYVSRTREGTAASYTLRNDSWGLHYAVDGYGNIVKGGSELKVLWTSNGWNGNSIGIEMISVGSVRPVLTNTNQAAWSTTYPPSPNPYYAVVDSKLVVISNAYSSYPNLHKNTLDGTQFQWVNLGFKYNGSQYYQEFTEELITSLEALIKDILARYPKMRDGITGKSAWTVFGLTSKPTPNGNFWSLGYSQIGTQTVNQPGLFAHSTGQSHAPGTGLNGMHSDTSPTPRLIAMLVRLGYQDI